MRSGDFLHWSPSRLLRQGVSFNLDFAGWTGCVAYPYVSVPSVLGSQAHAAKPGFHVALRHLSPCPPAYIANTLLPEPPLSPLSCCLLKGKESSVFTSVITLRSGC